MLTVPLMSIAAFILALDYDDWKWADMSDPVCFTHSIIGIVTIGFSIIQVFLNYIISFLNDLIKHGNFESI